jgi:hypothetical protein
MRSSLLLSRGVVGRGISERPMSACGQHLTDVDSLRMSALRHYRSFASICVADFSSHQRRLSATRNPALLVRHEALC